MTENNSPKPSTAATLKRLLVVAMDFKSWFITALAVSLVVSIIGTYRPILTGQMVDLDILKHRDAGQLINHSYWLIGLVLAEVLLSFALVYLSGFIAQNVIRRIREKLFDQLIHFRTSFFDKTPLGVLVTRAVSDVETIATVYTDGFLMVFGDVLRLVIVLVAMFKVNVELSFIALVILPLMLWITRFFQKKFKISFASERNWTATQNSFVQERLSGMSIIQVFNREKAEFGKFEQINKQLEASLLKTVFYFSMFFPIVEVITSVFIGLIIFYGGFTAVEESGASAGEIIAFIQFINMLIRPLRQIADRFNNIQRGLIGAERVFGLMDQDFSIPNQGQISDVEVSGDISFKNVHFAYTEQQKVLNGISFDLKAGEKIAIVGKTGAGKSTIINLISRMYDIEEGEILLDGQNLKAYELGFLRQQIKVVLQDVFLFNTTILENLKLDQKKLSLADIKTAAQAIEIDDYIESLPGGYGFEVSERGNAMSLGQRQLISFLRVALSNPKILVLDEATSSIDYQTEALIQNATAKITQGRTSIIIAHRLSTIVNADKIMVMAHGQIVEMGSHQELLQRDGAYAKLYQSQLKNQAEEPFS
jgi:ATP-binding cassette, subfamily B, multidrug efflux pump